MKKIYFTLLAVMIMMLSSACNDVLDYSNPNAPTDATFWKTPQDAERGLTAVYHQLIKESTYSRWIFFRYDLTSDEGYSNSPWTELADWTRFNYLNYNFWEGGAWIWRDHYKGIFRANQVITYVPEIEFGDSNRQQEIIAEAKFIRALLYYNLVVLWEEVPIVTEPSNPDDQPAQRSEEEVWNQIIQDLTEAANILPERWDATEAGRPTKGSAHALLGRAYMQNHDWEQAYDALQWLVEGPGAAYYDLVDNYRDNFMHTTAHNMESVFEVVFSDVNRGGKGDGSDSNLGFERPQFFAPGGIGWQDGQARRWLIDEYKSELNLDGGYDTRLKWSIFYSEMGDDFENNNLIYGRTWEEGGWAQDAAYIRKYSSDYFRDYEDYYSPNNFRVIRYAEVLLNFAEVVNELEGPQQAVQYVNRVRQRPSTNLAPLQSSPYSTALSSQNAFRERLKMERTLELNHEGIRWADLKRWGMLESQEGIDELRQRDPSFDNFVIGRHHRLPIPQSEVENNPNLNQLSGY
ncbi:RagB/SusD family nutrient uptake outer membrane protein [Rhodohalobacter sp. 614A]|uniref:RagB/SusD family nutrient uptake outer membrane protein n=1 Tax=Rhodohalobacter sp. 614A TaxID=2908649 RepID=UPI001F160C51|nr:RagB/SusD family nutrient uptake outer membrane protein [Rhodohalobacter sp. 614A]